MSRGAELDKPSDKTVDQAGIVGGLRAAYRQKVMEVVYSGYFVPMHGEGSSR